MDERGVVVLRVVLEQHLPVEGAHVRLAEDRARTTRSGSRRRRRPAGRGRTRHVGSAVLTQTVRRHSATATGLSPKSSTSKPSGSPTPDALRQRSVEAVQPRVVRAADHRSGAGRPVLAERRRPVAAHVEKSAQLAVGVAHQQHRQAADDDRRPLLGRRQLVGDADAHPSGPEHTLQLVAMERRRRRTTPPAACAPS